jgi:hypothetical protein
MSAQSFMTMDVLALAGTDGIWGYGSEDGAGADEEGE